MAKPFETSLQNYFSECTDDKMVAYFSMEYAIEQPLKIYSGGLGFLAGSHMRSAYDLKKKLIGIGILWKYGYYDQTRDSEQMMRVDFIKKQYSFLEDTGIVFPVNVHDAPVFVKAYYLAPEIFGSAPMFFLSTDIPENDFISQTITHKLYDSNEAAKIAQSIILGTGGGTLIDLLKLKVDIYHLNEGHGIPLAFYLYSKYRVLSEVKKRLVFTTHTPELAGNEEHRISLLEEMSFFCSVPLSEVKHITHSGDTLNYTLAAFRFSKKANAVSKLHEKTTIDMWNGHPDLCPITSITNAQNRKYWMDAEFEKALEENNDEWLIHRKKVFKKELFSVVADQTGKLLDPDVLTIVWARRFAGYKRADLILRNYEKFLEILNNKDFQLQVIWAGKPYPEDYHGIDIFNNIAKSIYPLKNCAILTGHELKLSGMLKRGADVWLNNPRFPREASGTSGMTAAMNGAINFSIADGWVPEFAVHGVNSFVIPHSKSHDHLIIDNEDSYNLMRILEDEVIPTYYQNKSRWMYIVKNGMRDVYQQFDSDRMVNEYYDKIYNS